MKLRYFSPFVSLLFIFSSCNKHCGDYSTTPVNADYFIFGVSGGFCGDCYHYYRIQDSAIYEDSVHIGTLAFNATPMPAAQYQIAAPLLTDFPSYLNDHPNTTFGCNGCADQLVFYIEIKSGTDTTIWRIDDVEAAQPALIKPYIAQMKSVISQLQ